MSTKSINGLIEKFSRMLQFCNGDLNKFVFLLRKGVYPYEHKHSWERFNETLYQIKNIFTVNYFKKILVIKVIRLLKMCLENFV